MREQHQALKDLVQVTRDSQELYEAVAQRTDNRELAMVCRRLAAAKSELIDALKLELVSMGSGVPADGTLGGDLLPAVDQFGHRTRHILGPHCSKANLASAPWMNLDDVVLALLVFPGIAQAAA